MSELFPSVDESELDVASSQVDRQANIEYLRGIQQDYRRQQRRERATIEAGPHLRENIPVLQKRLEELDAMSADQQRELLAWELEFLLAFLPPEFEDLLIISYLRLKLRKGGWNLQRLVHRRHSGGCQRFPELFDLLASYDYGWLQSRLRNHEFFVDAIPQQQDDATREV